MGQILIETPYGHRIMHDEKENFFWFAKGRFISGASILVEDSADNILLVRQFRRAINAWTVELPRGGIDAGEAPDKAACRELFEETGILANPSQLTAMGVLFPDTGTLGYGNMLFRMKMPGVLSGRKLVGNSETTEILSVNRIEVLDMIRKGAISDGVTVAHALRGILNA